MARYSTSWFRVESNPEPHHGRMMCSYCDTEMKVVEFHIKRPVPPGAKDLNLFDDIVSWQCPKCEAKSENGLQKCSCGVFSVDSAYANSAMEVPIRLVLFNSRMQDTFGCSRCEACGVCELPLNTHEYTWHTETAHVHTGHSATRTTYFHRICAMRMHDEQKKLGTVRSSDSSAKAEAISDHAVVTDWEKEWEQERSSIDARRRSAGLCEVCGKPLGIFDKLQKKRKHSGCVR